MLRTCVTPTSPMRLCTKMKYPCDTEPNNFVICRQIPRPPAAPKHSLVANCVLVHLCRSVPEFRLELLTVPVTPCMMCLRAAVLGQGIVVATLLGKRKPIWERSTRGRSEGDARATYRHVRLEDLRRVECLEFTQTPSTPAVTQVHALRRVWVIERLEEAHLPHVSDAYMEPAASDMHPRAQSARETDSV